MSALDTIQNDISPKYSQELLELLEQIRCPISGRIYKIPVLSNDGEIYEEDVLLKLISENKDSPITNQKLDYNISRIYSLQNLIDIYLDRYPFLKDQVYNNTIDTSKLKIHFFHEGAINYAVRTRRWNDMLDYTDYDATKLKDIFGHILINAPGNVLKHIIDNCPEIGTLKIKLDEYGWYSDSDMLINMVGLEKYHDKLEYFIDCPHIDLTNKFANISEQKTFIYYLIEMVSCIRDCNHTNLIKKVIDRYLYKGVDNPIFIKDYNDRDSVSAIFMHCTENIIQYTIDKLAPILHKKNDMINNYVTNLKSYNGKLNSAQKNNIIAQLEKIKINTPSPTLNDQVDNIPVPGLKLFPFQQAVLDIIETPVQISRILPFQHEYEADIGTSNVSVPQPVSENFTNTIITGPTNNVTAQSLNLSDVDDNVNLSQGFIARITGQDTYYARSLYSLTDDNRTFT